MTECSGSCTTLASNDTVKNLYKDEDATTQVRLPSGGKYQLKEAPSKVKHSLPSSSSSIWKFFYDGSMWEDEAKDTRASRIKLLQTPT